MADTGPGIRPDMLHLLRKMSSAVGWRWRCRRAVATARRDSLANLTARPVRRVLVVCYGNIYRSPFVAAYLQQVCGEGLEVRSCGFHARPGRASPERHISMSRVRGVDLSGHRSAVVGSVDLAWADIVVLMDRHNWQALQLAGAPADRLVWLGALDDGPVEIPDPYSLDEQAARNVVHRLEACAARLVAVIGLRRTDGAPRDFNRPATDGATPGA